VDQIGYQMRRHLLVFASLLLVPPLHAQTFAALVNREASTSAVDFDSTLKTSGTLAGDFAAVENPLGTQTRLGFFGGSGNMPIPATVDVLSVSGGSASPDGVLGLALDLQALTGSLHGLALDLAPGSAFAAGTALCLALWMPLPLAAQGPGAAPPPGEQEQGEQSEPEDDAPTSTEETGEESPPADETADPDESDEDGEENDEGI
jgi:hypothetical protein